MNFGDKISQIRKSAGLSQEQFGELFNVSRQSVSKWETNQTLPETQTLIHIAKTFHVSLDELLLDIHNENSQSAPSEIHLKKKKLFWLGVVITAASLFFEKEIAQFLIVTFDFMPIAMLYFGKLVLPFTGVGLCIYSILKKSI